MACDCVIYSCLNVVQNFTDCPTVVELDFKPTTTETLQWMYEFNGKWFGGTVDAVQGQNLVLPYVFNENYIHKIKFYSAGALLDDTCFNLDTSSIAGTYDTNATSNKSLTFQVSADGDTVINDNIAGRTILIVATDNQSYAVGVSFTQAGNSFTMTNGTSFYTGQNITLIFA